MTIQPGQIALRTYALALSLALGPSLLPVLSGIVSKRRKPLQLARVVKRELRHDALAFSLTVAVGGGTALCQLRKKFERHLSQFLTYRAIGSETKDFIANAISCALGLVLLHSARRRTKPNGDALSIPFTLPVSDSRTVSHTIDLTILLFIRALDAFIQSRLFKPTKPPSEFSNGTDPVTELQERLAKEEESRSKEKRKLLLAKIDAFTFWAASARIMWCFFYQQESLPRSYVKWIDTLARVDHRLLQALREIKAGTWLYAKPSTCASLTTTYSQDIGYPPSWGDPAQLPAYGGPMANEAWKSLGVNNRSGVGGLPCELVHGDLGTSSCTSNSIRRGVYALAEAMLIYIPAHFIPVLLARPQSLLQPTKILSTLLAAFRSATFLSTFIASFFFAVCSTRTLVLARLFPFISHNFWDSPWGCIMAGCLTCGQSIFIEDHKRRGEMALYVLPRAFKSCLPHQWAKGRTLPSRMVERIVFVISLSYLLTTAIHRPDSLRGLSRWTLAFVMRGPNAGFWKRKRSSPDVPLTPSVAPTPAEDKNG